MKLIQISSFSNDRVKYATKLREKKFRDEEKKILIEGYREILRAYESGKIRFSAIYFCRDCFLGENEDSLIEEIDTLTLELPRNIFEKISYRDRPDGLIAIAEQPEVAFDYSAKDQGNLFLVIEGVEKPGNLGTILRTADGAGVSAVFITTPRIDLFNPNVIRASTGILFSIPVYVVEIEELFSYFKKEKIQRISLSPEAKQNYTNQNYTKKTALIFGNEQYGLSEYAKDNVDHLVSIPMKGSADSLNLAMSCGILCYEVLRQRNFQ
jgi:RNA methyltransferase, TrmH family